MGNIFWLKSALRAWPYMKFPNMGQNVLECIFLKSAQNLHAIIPWGGEILVIPTVAHMSQSMGY